MTQRTVTPDDLVKISDKLDVLLREDKLHVFDPDEVKILQTMIKAWESVSGIVTIGKYVGILLAFIVVFSVNFSRIMELLGIWKAAP